MTDAERLAVSKDELNAAFDSWAESNPTADAGANFSAGVSWALRRALELWKVQHHYTYESEAVKEGIT